MVREFSEDIAPSVVLYPPSTGSSGTLWGSSYLLAQLGAWPRGYDRREILFFNPQVVEVANLVAADV